MGAPPLTGQLSRDILLIKSLDLGVVIGVVMTCCCVFNTFSYLRTFPTYGHPLVPRCPDKRGLSVQEEENNNKEPVAYLQAGKGTEIPHILNCIFANCRIV